MNDWQASDDEFIDASEVAGARPAVVDGKTAGLSPKAVLAFLFPFIATCVTVLGSWVTTGELNDAELRAAAAGLAASALAALGAYVGRTGAVEQ